MITLGKKTERRRLAKARAARWLLCAAAFLRAMLAPVAAHGADEEVVPPRPLSDTSVPYPAEGIGDAEVLLALTVEADGTVSHAEIVEGASPFAERAKAEALGWRFTPARRGSVALPARIQARVAFHAADVLPDSGLAPDLTPAEPRAPATSGPPAPATASEAAPEAERTLDVTVRGLRREAGQTTLARADIREMPGAFGDAFRAIEALPGVVPMVSGLPYFFIRGGPPNNNGYEIDGIRVPLLFHLGLAQSVIHPGLIDRVDFFPGAAPARHGGVAGATIEGRTRTPAETPHAEANVRLVDAGALVESPFANGRGSVLLAGRYGYPGPILGAISSGLDISYADYQARARWRFTDEDSVTLFAFGSHDHLSTPSPSADPTAKPNEQFSSNFHRLDLQYQHRLEGGEARLALTGGHDRQGAAPTYVRDLSFGARLDLDDQLGSGVRLRAGARAQRDAYGFSQNPTGPFDPPVPSTANPPPTDLVAGLYADVVWSPHPRLEVIPGARFELFTSSRASEPDAATRVSTQVRTFDPRFAARLTLTPGLTSVTSLGVAHQYPALRVGSLPGAVATVPGFPFGGRQLQKAMQLSQGWELALPAGINLGGTLFMSRWTGLTDLTAVCVEVQTLADPSSGLPPFTYRCPDDQPVKSHAYGLELLVRRNLSEKLTGWLSYTLSRAVREARFINAAGDVAHVTVPSDADRTHVLNAVVAYTLGGGWRAGTRLLFQSGTPYSNLDGTLPVPPYNAYRNPLFFRVDVRVECRWPLGRSGSLALVVEGQNVTLSKETNSFFLDCRDSPGVATQCKQGTVGPITLPSVGVEASF